MRQVSLCSIGCSGTHNAAKDEMESFICFGLYRFLCSVPGMPVVLNLVYIIEQWPVICLRPVQEAAIPLLRGMDVRRI